MLQAGKQLPPASSLSAHGASARSGGCWLFSHLIPVFFYSLCFFSIAFLMWQGSDQQWGTWCAFCSWNMSDRLSSAMGWVGWSKRQRCVFSKVHLPMRLSVNLPQNRFKIMWDKHDSSGPKRSFFLKGRAQWRHKSLQALSDPLENTTDLLQMRECIFEEKRGELFGLNLWVLGFRGVFCSWSSFSVM